MEINVDEERLRDIVECSGDYIWESDAHGAVTFFSGGPRRIDFMSGLERAAADPILMRSDVDSLRLVRDAPQASLGRSVESKRAHLVDDGSRPDMSKD